MNHPMTDEMIDKIFKDNQKNYDEKHMEWLNRTYRAAYDLAIEKVEKSVERNLKDMSQRGYVCMCMDLVYRADAIEEFFEGIMQEMRPQEDQ